MPVRGGQKLKAFMRRAKSAQGSGPRALQVGFFEDARYPTHYDGIRGGRKQKPHPVALVAIWNEFGTRPKNRAPVPERPFMRQAASTFQEICRPVLKNGLNPRTMTVTTLLANRLGIVQSDAIKKSIRDFNDPDNTAATKAMKRKKKGGKTKVLIDTGLMLNSVTYSVES